MKDETKQLWPPSNDRPYRTQHPFATLEKLWSPLLAGVVLAFVFQARAQVTVKVDSTKNWQGYNNVTQTNGFAGYVFGNAWAVPDLRAEFLPDNSPSGWPLSTVGILRPNTNTYAPGTADPPDTNFWNYPDGTPNKFIEANWYVDVFTNFQGQSVTFEGTILSNSIPLADLSGLPTVSPASWQVTAWIKEFTPPNYGFVGITETANLSAGAFSVNRTIAAGNIAQYGIKTFGPNTAPGSPNSFTGLGVAVEDSDPAVITQPVGGSFTVGDPVSLTAKAVGATALSYQWLKNGTNVPNGGNISGATTTNLSINPSVAEDSGDYSFVVTDTAGSATSAVARVTVVNILITDQPDDLRVQVGSTAVISAKATSPSALIYRWGYLPPGQPNYNTNITLIGTPFPYKPANITGFATDTLTVSNAQLTNSGSYVLRIYDGTSFVYTEAAQLLVRTPADYANFLENPGFENDPNGLDESPWVRFGGPDTSYGTLQDANDMYFGGGNVNVHEGSYVSYTTFSPISAYTGIYQDVAASPGQIFAADMWFYNATGDPIPGPSSSSTNETYLEVQFRAGGTVLQQYTTSFIDYNFPQDQWIQLPATNAGGFGTMPPDADAEYLVAPPGTTTVRFQVTLHDIAASGGNGSLYYDSARLMLKVPVAVSVARMGANIELSWETQGATSYQVVYKDNLDDPAWTPTGSPIPGDGSVKSVSLPTSGAHRYYAVQTL